jgi:hypothetical protein
VIVEIGQQRGARAPNGGMDIAVDPRGGHARSLNVVVGGRSKPHRKCAAEGTQVQAFSGQKPPSEARV